MRYPNRSVAEISRNKVLHFGRRARIVFAAAAAVSMMSAHSPANTVVTYVQNANGQVIPYNFPSNSFSVTLPIDNLWSQSYTSAVDNYGDVYETAPSNWSTPNYPDSPTDDVVIHNPVILDVPVNIGGLDVQSGGTVTLSNTTITLNDTSGGTIESGGAVNGYGTIDFTNGSNGSLLVNNGTIAASAPGGIVYLTGSATLGSFTNAGAITAVAGAGVTDSAPWINAGGSVTADGYLTINNTLTGSGVFTAENTGTISVTGLWTGSGTTTIHADTGTVFAGGGLTGTFAVTGSGFSAAGTLTDVTVNGNVTVPNEYAATLSGPTYLNGTTTLVAATLNFDDNSSLTISSNGMLHGYGVVGDAANNGGTLLINNGTIVADVPGGNIYVADVPGSPGLASFINNGTVLADPSAVFIYAPVSGAGTFTASNGGQIDVYGSWTSSGNTVIHADAGTVNAGDGLSGTFIVTGEGFDMAGPLTNVTINGNVTVPSQNVVTLTGTNKFDATTTLDEAQINFTDNSTLTIPSGATMQGWGSIGDAANHGGTSLINNGTIAADVPGGNLYVADVPGNPGLASFINNGTIVADPSVAIIYAPLSGGGTFTASNGGQIDTYSSWTGSSTTTIHADTGTVNAGDGLSGTFNVTGNGLVAAGTLSNVTVNGNITVPSQNAITLAGVNHLNGTTTLPDATINFGDNATLTIPSGATLQGWGAIGSAANNGGASLINNGTIEANVAGGNLIVSGSPALAGLTNNGTLLATSGGGMSIAAGVLTNLSGTTLTGGTYEVDSGSTLDLSGSIVTNAANVILSGTAAGFISLGALAANSGTLTVENGSAFSVAGGLSNSHLITVSAGSSLTVNGLYSQSAGLTKVGGNLTINGAGISITGGQVDLTDGVMNVVYGPNPDPLSTIIGYLKTGDAGGKWNGPGIISSTVSSLNASQSRIIYSVGYADGSDGVVNGLASGEIEILPTLAGDAKMQGNVVFGDFQLLSQYFGETGTTWDEGNFSYGSTTNFGDFQLLSQNFGSNASALTGGEFASLKTFAAQFGETLTPNPDGVGFSLVSVPEPASIGLLLMAGSGLLTRRRRKMN